MIQTDAIRISAPTESLRAILESEAYAGDVLDPEILTQIGFFVVRGALAPARAEEFLDIFRTGFNDGTLTKNPLHPTELKLNGVAAFDALHEEPGFQAMWPHLYGGNVGSSFMRMLIKNENYPNPVPLHQDIGYQCGGIEQYSLFTSLSDAHPENGGLQLYPGTHQLGYLGDVGKLNPAVLPEGFPVAAPRLQAGDVLVMHSATWHFSEPYIRGNDRVYLELHILPADSPFSQRTIHGVDTGAWNIHFSLVNRQMDDFFESSRTMRLKQAEERLKAMEN